MAMFVLCLADPPSQDDVGGPLHARRLLVIGIAVYGGATSYKSRVVVLDLKPRNLTPRPNVIIHIYQLGGIQASQRHLNPITQNFFMH